MLVELLTGLMAQIFIILVYILAIAALVTLLLFLFLLIRSMLS